MVEVRGLKLQTKIINPIILIGLIGLMKKTIIEVYYGIKTKKTAAHPAVLMWNTDSALILSKHRKDPQFVFQFKYESS